MESTAANKVTKPSVEVIKSRVEALNFEPASRPSREPEIIATTLMMVPKPINSIPFSAVSGKHEEISPTIRP